MQRRVIVDTSSMLFGFSNGKDVFGLAMSRFGGSRIVISSGVLRELRGIARNEGRRGAAAKAALKAVSLHRPMVSRASGSVDAWIEAEANDYKDAVVITNDTELLKRLKRRRASVLLFKLSRSGLLKGF
ncbi:MAG: hypothetical protein KGH98_04085 [Candidatus Micrarchaeota archaeon]|nr:hypothetical protein [Candidatus Micrarchaeota archaeon]